MEGIGIERIPASCCSTRQVAFNPIRLHLLHGTRQHALMCIQIFEQSVDMSAHEVSGSRA